jgi:homoprotocatechuate degradation regulator HpaR
MSQSKTAQEQLRLRSFDRSLPMSLLRAREAVMKKFIPSLQEHGLSTQQWRSIRALIQEDGLEISTLANRCHLLLPSMSRIIQNLEARDLIKRASVKADQRRNAIFLTDAGRELFKAIEPKSAERYEFITQQFGEEKLEQLYELLQDLVISLEEN